jgi:hypothetical protein
LTREFLRSRETFVQRYAYRLDGCATQRVADLVRRVIAANGKNA